MAESKFVRMRAGFSVTRDAQYRIVRRYTLNNQVFQWCVERWSPGELRWERLTERRTLADAREYIELERALEWPVE